MQLNSLRKSVDKELKQMRFSNTEETGRVGKVLVCLRNSTEVLFYEAHSIIWEYSLTWELEEHTFVCVLMGHKSMVLGSMSSPCHFLSGKERKIGVEVEKVL